MSDGTKKRTHAQMATSHNEPQDHTGSDQDRNTDTLQPPAPATPMNSDQAGHSHVASSAPGSAPGTIPSRGPEFAQGAVRAQESTMDLVEAVGE
jgi:hypothetical protein